VSEVVVRAEGAGKGYRLYRRPADRLRELLFRRPLHQTHWALRGVSLELGRGETFGLVGENGAGKSTLLKLMAGTSRPSEGRVEVRGRVAALLELGAGFHPEESGRDNVHLMGALAGVEPADRQAYYEAVSAFSELPEEVLGRPVKTYSSGMFMRLAFAAATAIEPEVLIIDEALSVGDLHFQKKSLDRIMRFRTAAKTVLFCSHNLYQVRSLCDRAAWLHEGRVRCLGETDEVVSAYEDYEREKTGAGAPLERPAIYRPLVEGTAPVRIASIAMENAAGNSVNRFESLQPADLVVEVEAEDPEVAFHVGLAVIRNDRENVFGTSTHFDPNRPPLRAAGHRRVVLHLPRLMLLSGEYALSVYLLDDSGLHSYDLAEQVCRFAVRNPGRDFGIVSMDYQWRL
jgi:lipopolysaccharide transport system ATP-binding protein